ncbi:MAG: S8 family peptidase [Ignavibacteriales bacterium]|nr:MAG: S8 family peptidase [Ignavibacteriales bacterium]
MKKILFTVLICAVTVLAQSPLEKVSPLLQQKVEQVNSQEKILVWIFFNDKGTELNTFYSDPRSVVSEKSLKRREKVYPVSQLINYQDLPVQTNYIETVQSFGFELKQKSKWFNGISGYITKYEINSIVNLPFVKNLDIVYALKKNYEPLVQESSVEPVLLKQPENTYSYNYGSSFTQMNQISVPAVHDSGYTGQGITICVLDAGFNRLSHIAFADMNIIAAWDFVNGDPDVGDGNDMGTGTHGTQTLSTIGGFSPGNLIGPAFDSDFILAKTENTESETPIEEDNWIAAVEWADSIGVDVTSTSLGYIGFDTPYPSYTWQSMNGNTCRITIAADLAVARGIVVVNSAGNEGSNSSHNTLGAPADGDSVIAVGSVTSTGTRSSFSSVGPTVDGRTKPDIMAMGSSTRVASPYNNNNFTTASGTSFSCPLAAGVAALILCANPNLTPLQVRDAMRNTASRHTNPDNEYGWGILNTLAAIQVFPLPVELTSFNARYSNDIVNLEWITSSEKNNYGFEIQRETETNSYETIGFVEGKGTTSNNSFYTFTDEKFSTGKNYYRLKQIDYDGSFKYSNEILVDIALATSFRLSQNYPNPFNPSTKIDFTVPVKSNVKVKIFDVLGNELMVILNSEVEKGIHSVNINMNDYPSGIYFVNLSAGDFNQSIKINLLK